MKDLFIINDKKIIKKYTIALKKLLSLATRYGMDKGKSVTIDIVNCVDIKEQKVYPMVILNYLANPWSTIYSTPKCVINSENIPSDIIFDTTRLTEYKEDEPYLFTQSNKVNLHNYKTTVTEIKELRVSVIDGKVFCKIPGVIDMSYNDGYSDTFKDIPGCERLIEKYNKFPKTKNFIDDVNLLKCYSDLLLVDTQTFIPYSDPNVRLDNDKVHMYAISFPHKMESLDLWKVIEFVKGDTDGFMDAYLSSVLARYKNGLAYINLFYRYIDIWAWTLLNKDVDKKEVNNGDYDS